MATEILKNPTLPITRPRACVRGNLALREKPGLLGRLHWVCWVVPGQPIRLFYKTNPNLRFKLSIYDYPEPETDRASGTS